MNRQNLDKSTWLLLREDINGSYDFSENTWGKIIELFNQRVKDYYFTPIDSIIKLNKRKGEGFSILTLQCALIEMFAAFRVGKIHNYRKKQKGGPDYEYKGSNSCFVEFLQNEEIFENHFFVKNEDGSKELNQPFDANDFYDNVRCGLMHEARTKENWLITSAYKNGLNGATFITKNVKDNTKSINRTILQKRLKNYFEEKYLLELKTENEAGNILRRFLARKLDHLHNISVDTNFEWWLDK